MLELLAAGLPTLAYDVAGTRELLGPVGPEALIPAGDPEAMAVQVARVLSLPEPEYAALAERSRAVAARFRWRDIARRTLAVYESARENRRTR
jgi:glycosyltransferase involved in cell wall biosynthesis